MAEIPHLARKLGSEGEKFLEFFSKLTELEWNTEIYTEGTTWTIRSILIHFVTAESAFLNQLFPNVLEGGGGATEDFSIDRYNARQQEKSQNLTIPELLDRYRSVRAEMVRWVSNLNESDLDTNGRHPFLGWTTLREMIKTVYIHNSMHYRDIRKMLGKRLGS